MNEFRFSRADTQKLIDMKDDLEQIEKAIKDAEDCEIDTTELKSTLKSLKKKREGMLKHYAAKD